MSKEPAVLTAAAAILQLEENAAMDRVWAAESNSTQRGYVDTLRFKYDETTEENKALRASFEIFLANRNATSEVCL